jgi:enoyl-CoA hydratase
VQLVRYEVARAIATLTLDSPHNRNALSMQLVQELTDHLAGAASDDTVRAIVITHTGTVFCAGADLREQSAEGGPERGTQRMLGLLKAVIETPKPIIARVDGAARAGGVGLVGSCDLAFASRASTFAFTEVRLGLAPAIISLTTLGRLTERAAARYCLTGETFDATAAAAAGLLTAAADDLDAELEVVLTALRACSPQGLAATKPLTTAAALDRFAAQAEPMRALSARLFASAEAREGMAAFLQKRPPSWAAT